MATKKESVQIDISILGAGAKKEFNDLQNSAAKLKEEIKGIKGKSEEATKAKDALKLKLAEVNEEMNKLRKENGLAGATLKDLATQSKFLRSTLAQLVPGTDAFIQKTKELQAVEAQMAKVRKEIAGISEELDKPKKGNFFTNIFSNASNLIKSGVIIGVATQVFQIGKEFLNLTAEVNKSRESVAKFSELTGEALNDTTAKTRAVAETFGKDFNEVLGAANSLSKAMGISFDESLALIEKGFVKGADINGDFLDKVKEYPIQFKQAGLTAEEFIKVAIQEPKSGIFSDKLLDTIKEVGLSLREMTKAQRDALDNAFGAAFTSKLAKDIDAGRVNTVQALKLIDEEAKRTGLTVSQMQTLTADLFKGAGEDAGGFEKIMQEVNNALSSNINELSDQEKQVQANAKASEEYNKALGLLSQNFEGLGTAFGTFFTNILTTIIKATNAVVDFFSLADSRSKKLVANLSFNTEQEAKKSILTIQAQLNAEKAKAEKLQKLIDSGLGKTQTRIDLKNTQDSIKVLEKAIQNSESKLTEIRQKAIDKNKGIDATAAKDKNIVHQAEIDAVAKKNAKILEEEKKHKENLLRRELEYLAKIENEKNNFEQKIKQEQEGKTNLFKSSATIKKFSQQKATDEFAADFRPDVSTSQRQFDQAKGGLSISALKDKKGQLLGSLDAEKTDKFAAIKGDKEKELEIEKEYNAKKLQVEKDFENSKYAIRLAGLATAKDILGGVMELMSQESKGRKALGLAMKAAAIAEIVIRTQAEIAGYMAHPGSIASLGVVGGIKAGIAVARAAISIANVAKQKFAGGGQVRGNSHSAGGVPIEAEGGEFIFRKNVVTPDTLPIFERINQYGLKKYALGGLVNMTPRVPMSAMGASNQNDYLTNQLVEVMSMAVNAYSKPIQVNTTVDARVDPRKILDYNEMAKQAEKNARL